MFTATIGNEEYLANSLSKIGTTICDEPVRSPAKTEDWKTRRIGILMIINWRLSNADNVVIIPIRHMCLRKNNLRGRMNKS